MRKALIDKLVYILNVRGGKMNFASNSNPSRNKTDSTPHFISQLRDQLDGDAGDLLDELEAIFFMLKSPKIRMANLGLLKAGKSTLFNCISGNYQEEKFATGVTRTTTTAQEVDLGGLVLIDTPGIDCNEEDNEKTLEAMLKSDVILFVHKSCKFFMGTTN